MTTETKEQCPAHKGETSGSDSYSYNPDKNVGYCFSCGLKTWEFKGTLWGKHPNGQTFSVATGKTAPVTDYAEFDAVESRSLLGKHGGVLPDELLPEDQEVEYTPKAISEAPVGNYVAWRGISADTMEHFGVVTRGDQVSFKYPSGGSKVRDKQDKKFHAVSLKSDELFGMNLFPAGCSKKITVTEGEIDTLSAWQMLQKGNYLNPVVSVPSATPSGVFWEKNKKWLDSFEQIILSVDDDEPGRKLAEKFFDAFPDKVYVMEHSPYKDANDFLMNGAAQAYKNSWWGAKKYTPAGFTVGVDAWKKAVLEQNPYEYVPTHIEAYNKGGRGWIKGGTTILKAPPGTGKTSLFRGIQHDLVCNKGQKVAVLHMEEIDGLTGRGMATYELKTNVNTQEDQESNGVSDEVLLGAIEKVMADDKFMTFTVDPMDPIKSCLRQAKYAASAFDVDYIFIDHLQKLAYMAGTHNATEELTSLIVNLNELCVRKGVGIICISHINEDGKAKYAKSIEEEAYVIVDMVRDKKAEDHQERNTTYLSIDKNRPFAYTGDAGALVYDPDTTMVVERKGPQEPKGVTTDDF